MMILATQPSSIEQYEFVGNGVRYWRVFFSRGCRWSLRATMYHVTGGQDGDLYLRRSARFALPDVSLPECHHHAARASPLKVLFKSRQRAWHLSEVAPMLEARSSSVTCAVGSDIYVFEKQPWHAPS
jgi:hypothetical protein